MKLEPLQRVWYTAIIGVKRNQQIARRLPDRPVETDVLAAVLLVKVTDRKIRLPLPSPDQLVSSVAGTVVNDHPFEVAKGLRPQTLINPRQPVSPIVGLSGNREYGMAHERRGYEFFESNLAGTRTKARSS